MACSKQDLNLQKYMFQLRNEWVCFFTSHAAEHSTRVEVEAKQGGPRRERRRAAEQVVLHVHVSSEGFDCQVRWGERDLGAKAR